MRPGDESSSWDSASSAEESDLLTPGSQPHDADGGARRRRRRSAGPPGFCCRQVQKLEVIPGFATTGRVLKRACCNCNMQFLVCCNIWSAFGSVILIFLGAVAFPTGVYKLPEIDDAEEASTTCYVAGVMYVLCFGGTLAKIIVDKRNAEGPMIRRKRKRWRGTGQSAMYGQIGTDDKEHEDEAEVADSTAFGDSVLDTTEDQLMEPHSPGVAPLEMSEHASPLPVTRSKFKGAEAIPKSLPLTRINGSAAESSQSSSDSSSSSSTSSDESEEQHVME